MTSNSLILALALFSQVHLALGACEIGTSEHPSTAAPTTTTVTTTEPTTTTEPSTTTTPKKVTANVEICDSGYTPSNCESECGCPIVSFNSTTALKSFPNFVASKGNRTYVWPTIGIWQFCQPGAKSDANRISCPSGYNPETVFFDANKNVVGDYDHFVVQFDFNLECNLVTRKFELHSPTAPNATAGYFTCWQ